MRSPYFNVAEAAEYLRFVGPRAQKSTREWLRANRVPFMKRSEKGEWLILKEAIDAALVPGWKPQRYLTRVG